MGSRPFPWWQVGVSAVGVAGAGSVGAGSATSEGLQVPKTGSQGRAAEPRVGGVAAAGVWVSLGALGGITGQSEVVLWEDERVTG